MMLVELFASALIIVGGVFTLLGSIGLARLPDFFSRLHGPVKATTLGVGSIVVASLFAQLESGFDGRELAITLFLFITAPVSAHLLAKAALAEERRAREQSDGETEADVSEDARRR